MPEPLRYTGFLLRRAQQTHAAVWSRVVSTDVTSVQFGVLSVLADRPGASQRELCDALDLDRSTIAALVVRLERRGLIERERDAGDKRRNRLQLTGRGREELTRLVPGAGDVEAALIANLTPAERTELRRLLTLVLAAPTATTPGENDVR